MPRLTIKTVKAFPVTGADAVYWDEEKKGFGLRITANGAKSYFIKYRNAQGRSRYLTIGKHGDWTPEQAREQASKLLRQVDTGIDPAETKQDARTAITVAQLCDEYMEAARKGAVASPSGKRKKASTLHQDESRISAHIKPWLGKLPVKDLTQAQVHQFYEAVLCGKTARVSVTGKKRGKSIVTGGPTAGKRCVGLLGGMMTFAARRGYRPQGANNPAQRIGMPKDGSRDFRLEAEGWRSFAQKIKAAEDQGMCWRATTIARLLALTGCRKEEIGGLEWSEIDFEGGCLKFKRLSNDDDRVKSGTVRPIGTAALRILKAIKPEGANGNAYVFPSSLATPKPYQGFAKAWKRMGIDFPPHCLRHAFGSAAENDCGIHESTVSALLGHKKRGSVTRSYIVKPDAVLLAAADKISEWIAQGMGLDGYEAQNSV
ncbi:MAG: tyrosine-type recombinase/integrase [Rhodomicrobium sp.]